MSHGGGYGSKPVHRFNACMSGPARCGHNARALAAPHSRATRSCEAQSGCRTVTRSTVKPWRSLHLFIRSQDSNSASRPGRRRRRQQNAPPIAIVACALSPKTSDSRPEAWQVVSASLDGDLLAVILANPVMIEAYEAGVPGNGKPFPDGAKMAKVHWNPKKMETFPAATVPGTQHDVDFMVKDSKRFADSGGWGWAVFEYDAASDTFRPGTLADKPPQGNDAKCGFACHTLAKSRDYVFTDYGKR